MPWHVVYHVPLARTVHYRPPMHEAGVVSLVGAVFPILLGGSVVVEMVFGLPGVGRLAVRAAQNRDFPVVLTVNMFTALMVLLSNMLTDIFYTYLDPRIRLG